MIDKALLAPVTVSIHAIIIRLLLLLLLLLLLSIIIFSLFDGW
jgi:hypothetical protein